MDDQQEKTGGETKPQHQRRHPREWERDLDPGAIAGQKMGAAASEAERSVRTAYDRKDIHRRLRWFQDDELKKIPIVPDGQRLRQGATYIDIKDYRPRAFTATGDMSAGRGHCYIAKDGVPYTLWNRLTGQEKPAQEQEGQKGQ